MMLNNGNDSIERLQLHESVLTALQNCIEINNPTWTKETIKSLLVAESPQGVLDLICVLLEELSVFVLNSSRNKKRSKQRVKSSLPISEIAYGKPKASPKNLPNKQRVDSSNSRLSQHVQMENHNTLTKSTRLGTVALPKVLDDFKMPTRKNKSDLQRDDTSDVSASDIPSQSSESSNDAQSGNDSAVEAEWGLHLSTAVPQPPSVALKDPKKPNITANFAPSNSVPTHGDFLNSLVNDIEQLEQPQPAAALDEERIYIAIWTALTAEDNNVCTAETLNQLSRSLVHRLGLEEAYGERMEDLLAVRFAAFSGCPINTESCSLIAQVVKITVQQLQRDGPTAKKEKPVIEEPTTLELGSPQAVKSANEEDDDDDEFDISPTNRGKGSSGVKENSILRTPQVQTPGSKKGKKGDSSAGDGPCLPETPPAWLIPKSPMDSVFRKRYGGLGDPDLTQVITIIDSQRKSPKNRVTDPKEVDFDDEGSLYSPSLSTDSDDIGVDDLPRNFGWNEIDSPRQKSGSATKSSSKLSLNGHVHEKYLVDSNEGVVGDVVDVDDNEISQSEDIDPSNHPSTAVPRNADGSPMLTNNDTLNRMLVASFQGFVKQYADQGEKLHSLKQGSSSSTRPVPKSNSPLAVKRSSRAPSPKMSLSVEAFSKSSSPKERTSFEVATDTIDYDSYERLMDRTIRKTNQLIHTNSKNLRSLAMAVEEEERQRELRYPQTNLTVKSRSDSYLHVPSVVHSPTSAFRSSGSGSLGGALPVRRRSNSTSSKRKPKSSLTESQNEEIITQANKKVPAPATKARQASSRYQVSSGGMESDDEGVDDAAARSKSKKKLKKSTKKRGTSSSSSPIKSFQNPTFSTSQRVLDLDQADVPYPYSYPTPMLAGIVPPLGVWNNGLSRQNKQEYEKMIKKMAIAGQLQSRNSASSNPFSNGKKK